MSNATATSAQVTTLTAEVRVLMVGSRQVTLSVFRQLDEVNYAQCEAMGRVNDSQRSNERWVVGKDRISGALVRACFSTLWEEYPTLDADERHRLSGLRSSSTYRPLSAEEEKAFQQLLQIERDLPGWQAEFRANLATHQALPLIVLAGLR